MLLLGYNEIEPIISKCQKDQMKQKIFHDNAKILFGF